MAAFFLGELYLLKPSRRFLLLALGIPLALTFNVARTLFLTWQASSAGASAVAKWHDSAGMTISLICFACLWLIAVLISLKQNSAVNGQPSAATASLPAGGEVLGEAVPPPALHPSAPGSVVPSPSDNSNATLAHPIPFSASDGEKVVAGRMRCALGSGEGSGLRDTGEVSSSVASAPQPPSAPSPTTAYTAPPSFVIRHSSLRTYLFALGLWSLLCLATTEAWYRAHETDPAQTVHWSAQFPTNSPGARKIPMDKEIKLVLKFDQEDSLSWEEPDGSKWSAFFFRWRAGEATSRMAARDHRPEICLPSSGNTLKADLGIHFLPAHGLELPFRAYTFESAGRALHVFFCLWEDGADQQTGLGRSKYLDRLDSVRAGRRRLGQQTLEFVVSGYASMEEAEQAVRQRLPSLIQLGAGPGAITSLDQQGGR